MWPSDPERLVTPDIRGYYNLYNQNNNKLFHDSIERNAWGEIKKHLNFSFKYHRLLVIFQYVNWYPVLKNTYCHKYYTYAICIKNYYSKNCMSIIQSVKWLGYGIYVQGLIPDRVGFFLSPQWSSLALGPPGVLFRVLSLGVKLDHKNLCNISPRLKELTVWYPNVL